MHPAYNGISKLCFQNYVFTTKAKLLTDAARDRKVDEAIAASDVVIADLSQLFSTINQEAGSKVFLLPDDPEYEKRSDAYRSKMAEGKSKSLMKKDGDW